MKWTTSISKITDGEERVRGYELKELIGQLSFAQTVWLVLKGDLPSDSQAKMLEAMLVASVEHSIGTPSAMATRLIASSGSPLNAAVAGGLLALGDFHGGAIEGAARLLQTAVRENKTAAQVVAEIKSRGERVPGFGHRVLTLDPRVEKLTALAKELNLAGPHIKLAEDIFTKLNPHPNPLPEGEGEASNNPLPLVGEGKGEGKRLPLNIDGAMAAIISDLGFDWQIAKGFFMIGRLVGLIAHAHEEKTREKPVRRLDSNECDYDGPPPRSL
jgi:citryl-CoA lyase